MLMLITNRFECVDCTAYNEAALGCCVKSFLNDPSTRSVRFHNRMPSRAEQRHDLAGRILLDFIFVLALKTFHPWGVDQTRRAYVGRDTTIVAVMLDSFL
jgi:hypothetical protein